jgi:putative SOS response-associated peptidase YedK
MMCGRYVYDAINRDLEPFDLESIPELRPNYNVAPTQNVAVVAAQPGKVKRRLGQVAWGFETEGTTYKPINVRSESVFTKVMFGHAIRTQRCLIPASGFIEWRLIGSKKVPLYFQVEDEPLFAFAGIWSKVYGDDNKPRASCAIMTCGPNGLVSPIHDRMPVIIPRERYVEWLGEPTDDEIKSLLVPFPAERMKATELTTRINNVRNNDRACIEPAKQEAMLFAS